MANRSRNALLCRDELSTSSFKTPARFLLVPFLLAASLLVSGCGFEPVYAMRDDAGNQLRGRIAPAETGGLALYVKLDETRRDALVATDGNTERIDLTITATVRLETAAAEVVEQRRFRVSSSYNRTSSELANQETEASLRNTALDRIASDIQFLLADLSADASPPR